ncbi:hypothetical protein AB0H43_06300 [Hamadaea sp. NPDC050747]|uniref:hypothetical protein n=1 Tax=Hamadaea sp. NPDC050747 TaxID=3155789 RepID=UPI0033D505CC
MGQSSHFRYHIGQKVHSTARKKDICITELMLETLPVMRGVLIQVALRKETITYKQLSVALDRRYYPYQGVLGDALDVLSEDCIDHDERSLAALVVRGDTSEVGYAFLGDAAAEREVCYQHWAKELGA